MQSRIDLFENELLNNPAAFPEARRSSVRAGVVQLGMNPTECQFAAGAFLFEVKADPVVWKNDADPIDVILAQSTNPDDSRISMTFKNDRQFPPKETLFKVNFKLGVAVSLSKV